MRRNFFVMIFAVFLFCGVGEAADNGMMYAYQPQFQLKFEVYRVDGLPEKIFRTFDGYFVTRTVRGAWIYVYAVDDAFIETQILVGSVDPRGLAILNKPRNDKYTPPDGNKGEFFSTVYPKDNFSTGTLIQGAKTVDPMAPYYAHIMRDSGLLFDVVAAINGPIVKVVDQRLTGIDIKPGDIVTELNGRSVAGKDPEWVKDTIDARLESGVSVVLTYLRNNDTKVALLKPSLSKELRTKTGGEKTKPFSAGETWGENEEKFSFEEKVYIALRKMNEYGDINLAHKIKEVKGYIKNDATLWAWHYGYKNYVMVANTNGNKIKNSKVVYNGIDHVNMLHLFDQRVKNFTVYFGAPPSQKDSGLAIWRLATGETFMMRVAFGENFIETTETVGIFGIRYLRNLWNFVWGGIFRATSYKVNVAVPFKIMTYELYPDYDIEVVESAKNFMKDTLR